MVAFRVFSGRPTLGSWLVYALGCESQDLPAYMVLTDPGGLPVDGVTNWSNGFMPAMFQSTVLRPKEPRILNLDAPAHLKGKIQRQNLDLMQALNRRHLELHPGEAELEGRIASYELAARMQTAAVVALDINQESAATHTLYGIDEPATREYGTRCLLVCCLVERGVRFVQLFHSGQPWDNHSIVSGLKFHLQEDRQTGCCPGKRSKTVPRHARFNDRTLGWRNRSPACDAGARLTRESWPRS